MNESVRIATSLSLETSYFCFESSKKNFSTTMKIIFVVLAFAIFGIATVSDSKMIQWHSDIARAKNLFFT